jgi:hypothetical protein
MDGSQPTKAEYLGLRLLFLMCFVASGNCRLVALSIRSIRSGLKGYQSRYWRISGAATGDSASRSGAMPPQAAAREFQRCASVRRSPGQRTRAVSASPHPNCLGTSASVDKPISRARIRLRSRSVRMHPTAQSLQSRRRGHVPARVQTQMRRQPLH